MLEFAARVHTSPGARAPRTPRLVLGGGGESVSGGRVVAGAEEPEAKLGVFTNEGDIGAVAHVGSTIFDSAKSAYSVTGGGANMWFAHDDFHFAWKQVSSDVTLAAHIGFVGPGKNAHRKACLIIRQSLESDSAYVDVAVHGDGLTSLQFRAPKGGATHEVQTNVSRPKRVRLAQRGQVYPATRGEAGRTLQVLRAPRCG